MNSDNLNGKLIGDGLTFDDVLLVPAKSEILPNEVNLKTKLTNTINLNIPLISAAMDTVTESKMAIALATIGGVGVIHKNLSIDSQIKEVKKVKLAKIKKVLDFEPVLDNQGRLLVGAAVSTSADTIHRVEKLVEAEVDFIVLDSAHGHSKGIIETIKKIREQFSTLQIVAGNIATEAAAKDLVKAGANCLKVGIGPGSICTTRVVAGIGVPQITAISNVYRYCEQNKIPFIADGGIKYSGDIVKAIGAGANVVMLGSIFAGTDETPGDVIALNGQEFKRYVGMGSMAAMERGSADRYFQKGNKKLVPEGIESIVPAKGPVSEIVFQLLGGLRSGMGYTGCADIETLRKEGKFIKITAAGLIESHPHDVKIDKSAPNYKIND
ncbi:inosine 5'-monophosphate dehydrogenase [Williamsoniiplasma somnilux]|uniref:Inosine 5'-monophosphate dehydrogenase n=1 Tax=Williamsoniiplasma somnilux TaxID=215578 RepID=A0A2K8P0F3_9MOLU|nr:IMP dehydrogenase [Williamsoniiplasma somnilux]ATZ18481.1 inosine 5'-monophosphate dehydrogenase [Williamsoniiplasma somnilux]